MTLAAIIGSAPCYREDYERLLAMLDTEPRIVTLNDMLVHWRGPVDVAATLHPELLAESDPDHPDGWSWMRQRHEAGHPDGYTTYSTRAPHLVHEVVGHIGGGSVSLYGGGALCRHLGWRAVLCGCPLDDSGVTEESTTSHTISENLEKYRRGWRRRLRREGEVSDWIRANVRSMGGYTRELLGEPDQTWLLEPQPGGVR